MPTPEDNIQAKISQVGEEIQDLVASRREMLIKDPDLKSKTNAALASFLHGEYKALTSTTPDLLTPSQRERLTALEKEWIQLQQEHPQEARFFEVETQLSRLGATLHGIDPENYFTRLKELGI